MAQKFYFFKTVKIGGRHTERDQSFLKFADNFEDQFIRQAKDEDRTIQETLDLGWKLLTVLPKTELKRVKDEFIEKYYPE